MDEIEEKWRNEKDQAITDFKKRRRDVSFCLIVPLCMSFLVSNCSIIRQSDGQCKKKLGEEICSRACRKVKRRIKVNQNSIAIVISCVNPLPNQDLNLLLLINPIKHC